MKPSATLASGLALAATATLGISACSSGSSSPSSSPTATESPSVSISASTSTTLPADWPAGIPTPTGLTLVSVATTDLAGTPRTTAIYRGPGTVNDVAQQMLAGLKAGGWQEINTITGEVVISNWQKDGMRVGLNIAAPKAGDNVTATVTVNKA